MLLVVARPWLGLGYALFYVYQSVLMSLVLFELELASMVELPVL